MVIPNSSCPGADSSSPTMGSYPRSCSLLAAVLPAASSQFAQSNPYLYPRHLLDALGSGDGHARDEPVRMTVTPKACPEQCGAAQPTSDVPRWWLIHTKPRQEKKLADQLKRLDVAHYLPSTRHMAVTRGRSRSTQAPLFPGYMFLYGDSGQRRVALETNRIVANHPVGDQQGIFRQLWDLADLICKGVPLRIEERLVTGQHVRVKSGLLKDKCGIVMKRVGRTRLFVYVSELLGGVSVEIEQHLLEPY